MCHIPQWDHDCDCAFLGSFGPVDVYQCGTTILARYGNAGGEYASRDMFGERSEYAWHLAMWQLIVQAQQGAFGGLGNFTLAVPKGRR
jgi:hypothetical protein